MDGIKFRLSPSFNINSIRNKLHLLSDHIRTNADILMTSGTRTDTSFSTNKFDIDGFSAHFWLNWNQ